MSLRGGVEFVGFTLREAVGPLMIGAGLLALFFPLASAGVVNIIKIVGLLLLASGILRGIALIGARQMPLFWLELFAVVLSIIVGLLVWRDPGQGLRLMTAILIIILMVETVAKFGLLPDGFPLGAGLLACFLVAIALALYFYSNSSVTSDWVLGFLLAMLLIFEGIALTYLNWKNRMRKTR